MTAANTLITNIFEIAYVDCRHLALYLMFQVEFR